MQRNRIREYQELAEGSIGSLDRNDNQPHSLIHISHHERRKSRCIATVDNCITSFETCDHDLIAAFDALHLLANHCSSVACFLFSTVKLGDMDLNLKLELS
jgi:hypothetical protein